MRAAGSAGIAALGVVVFAFVARGVCCFAGFAAVTFVAISFPGDMRRRGNPFSHAFTRARARSFPGDLSRRRGSGVVGIVVGICSSTCIRGLCVASGDLMSAPPTTPPIIGL